MVYGWFVMTVGILNTCTSFSKPDEHDESLSVDLIAVVIFPPIPDMAIGDLSLRDSRSAILLENLRDSRSAILLEIRDLCDPQSSITRHVC